MSEIQETRKSSKLKFTYIVTAVAISCLMIGASMGIIISGTTPTFPTVIEPGSQVSGASYVVFMDGANYYARNGTTGAIDYSSTNALTFLNQVIDLAPENGIIALGPGDYLWSGSNYLLVDKPGLTFIGAASTPITDIIPGGSPIPTTLGGNVSIISASVRMETLNIGGTLTITSDNPATMAAHWLRFTDICVGDGVRFVGVTGANSLYVPFNVVFEGGKIGRTTPGNILDFYNTGSGKIDHIFFYGVTIYQGQPGNVISMRGAFHDIVWTNTLFLLYEPDTTFLNLTLPPSGEYYCKAMGFTDSIIEIGVAGTTIFAVGDGFGSYPIDVFFRGGGIFSDTSDPLIINDHMGDDYVAHNKRVLFDGVYFDFTHPPNGNATTTLRFKSLDSTLPEAIDSPPKCLPVFVNCHFNRNTYNTWDKIEIVQLGTEQSVGYFHDNFNLNPVRIITKPFWVGTVASHTHAAITFSQSIAGSSVPGGDQNYTARDLDYFVTSTGGNVIITICDGPDPGAKVVLSGVTSLSHFYLPWGYTIKWHFVVWDQPPTVIVEGL